MDKELKLPIYANAAYLFISLLAFITILYLAQSIIIPLVFATIIAIVLHPIVNLFVKLKINRLLSILITLSLTFIIFIGFTTLLISQLSRFSESWPLLTERFNAMIDLLIIGASAYFDINTKSILEWIAKISEEIIKMSSAAIGQTLVILGSGLVIIFLIPVYIFMILFYQPLLRDFIYKVFSKKNQISVAKIVSQIKLVIQQYLIGLIIEFVMVAILNTLALILLGIEYAILLGIIGALLNIIPYLGGIISVALFMLVAFVTKSPEYVIYVVGAYSLIQFIDNNYIVPKIVASKVKINALFSIIVVIAGNALWGVSGMFLSIPLLAILKLIFDHVESLKPWGFLLGDTMPSQIKIKHKYKRDRAG
ncbi:MAG: AI-2E family transporter [Bacteroidetes bacterium]|nr:AI-2E family transporter [Bacteroidota bacterium]